MVRDGSMGALARGCGVRSRPKRTFRQLSSPQIPLNRSVAVAATFGWLGRVFLTPALVYLASAGRPSVPPVESTSATPLWRHDPALWPQRQASALLGAKVPKEHTSGASWTTLEARDSPRTSLGQPLVGTAVSLGCLAGALNPSRSGTPIEAGMPAEVAA
jgi:hypothetical protein